MKITRIETIRLPEYPQIIWAQIHTADGLIGLGETYHVAGAVEAVIHDYAAPFLLGQSAFDRERHWQNFFRLRQLLRPCRGRDAGALGPGYRALGPPRASTSASRSTT